MKPMGRKYYKDKTGGKHKTKGCLSWWEDLITPNKRRARQNSKAEIRGLIDESKD